MNSVLINEIIRQGFAAKQFRIMKLCLLFLLCGVLQGFASSSYAQTTTLSMKLSDVSIEEVLNQIEEQSDFRFLFNKKMVNVSDKVSISVKKKDITQILDQLFEGQDVAYTISNKQIVLSHKNNVPSVAQQSKKVTGVVKDRNGETIIGANVVVKGTQNGVITDLDGKFSIEVANPNAVLQVSYIGYKPQESEVGNRSSIEFVLASSVEELDEIVVTALGIRREKKALGYAMQEIKTDGMSENRSESVANMLQGKVAGVQINQSTTGMGGSTRVVLRGTSSLSGNNQPLWVIDGIPVSDNTTGTANQWGGVDYSGAASEINPEDIESISVLKGANAAAMYGSRAQNGAIIVTTKKGKSGAMVIEYNGNLSFSEAYNPYEYQNEYGQGSAGVFSTNAKGSWGPKMDGKTTIANWRNEFYGDSNYSDYAYAPQKDYISDFYRTGSNYTNTLTASGGSDNLTARFSFSDSRNQGITPNHSLNRQYYDLNTQFTSKFIDLSAKVNFMRQKANNRPAQGEYGVMKMLINMPRSIRLQDLQNPVGQDGHIVNWSGPNNEYLNPYALTLPANGNRDIRNRLIGKVQMSAKFTDYLKLTGRVGVDWYNDQIKNYSTYVQSSQTSDGSQYWNTQATNQEFNADLMLNFDKQFNNFSVIANVGTATTYFTWNNLSGSSGIFNIPYLVALANGRNQTVSEGYSKQRVNSVLGNATVGYKSVVYLDVTARNDWSSTLPSNNWSYFYPSVSLSGIVSEMVDLPEQISFLKVRGSWAKVGNDTNPYVLYNVYTLGKTNGNILNATTSSTYPLYNLQPEETTSAEGGVEMRMFNGRLGFDVTYYNSNTVNQILNVTMPGSSGYELKSINAGKMASKGIEVMLTGTPIQTKDWNWDITLNWGMNRTECVELDPTLKRFVLGETRVGKVVVDEGGRFGDIVSKAYKRNAEGRILIGDNGMPISESDKVIGNMTPDWTGSFSTALRYKNVSFNALVDIRSGGSFISTTDMYACTAGTSAKTLVGRGAEGMVINGVLNSTGAENTKAVKAEDYYATIGGAYGIGEEFLYDASYAKLRELSLGYTLPASWLRNLPIKSVKLSAVGRDLFYIFKNAPVNPEGSFSREDYAQAFEYSSLPPTRSYGFTLNVKF
ncbi:MAG: SusC/RagA family TonB-linked outer membrane protein [Paludibacter sp.]|nr:SusC/RagA family TonB-linked outer membrane protein [Paludibacter sp.]